MRMVCTRTPDLARCQRDPNSAGHLSQPQSRHGSSVSFDTTRRSFPPKESNIDNVCTTVRLLYGAVSRRSHQGRCSDAFMEILRSIHEAGVHHGDLRYENLLIDASGQVAIIDFDQATIRTGESVRREEYRKLTRLLKPKVDDSIREQANPGGRDRAHTKRSDNVEVLKLRRVTRSMGATRQTSGGMTLRPRR